MQHWTKTKPNKQGYWWAKLNDHTRIVYIFETEGKCYVEEDCLVIIENVDYDNYLWGNINITEPVGEKI